MTRERAASAKIWRAPLISWALLLVLLGLTLGAAYLPIGVFKLPVSLGIAGLKAALILIVFMRLGEASRLVKLAAGAGLLWLTFMFVLAGADFLSRG